MKTVDRQVTMTVQMTEHEYTILRILSERIRNAKQYIGAENWVFWMTEIMGSDENVDVLANLLKSEDE